MNRTVICWCLVVASCVCAVACVAKGHIERIQAKAHRVQAQLEQAISEGRNPSAALALMQQAKQAFDKGNAAEGERLVDQALRAVNRTEEQKDPLGKTDPLSLLYRGPEIVDIDGYDQDAMEPTITMDGKYLFFNNSNEIPNTKIFCAKRIGRNRFQFLGQVPGTHAASHMPFANDGREAVPAIDRFNRLYFTATRSYARDRKTLYVGQWSPEGCANVHAVEGDISPSVLGWINMDCGISPDGKTLVVSRAKIAEPVVEAADLFVARRRDDGSFELDPRSAEMVKNINTSALEYAPCITDDGLELYLTRAASLPSPGSTPSDAPLMQTMVALRKNVNERFGRPIRLTAIQGFAEAPTVTLDKKEMFFHKKSGGRMRIFRLDRAE